MDDDRTQQITLSVPPGTPPHEMRSLGSHFEYLSASLSHVGCVRTLNEDACLELTDRQLWVVADGMGGHMAGDVASRTVVDFARVVPHDPIFSSFVEQVENQLIGAHKALVDAGRSTGKISGSTVVAFLAHGRQGLVMWAGDSRLYLFRQGNLFQVSRDHSFVEELLAVGGITPEEARTHPRANVITRAVGAGEELVLDLDIFELQHGDLLLLCSDGLYKELEDREIGVLMARSDSPALIAQDLIGACLERRARDNVTVVVVRVVSPASTKEHP
jgi:serine/threonine protein phosphatase PrpC